MTLIRLTIVLITMISALPAANAQFAYLGFGSSYSKEDLLSAYGTTRWDLGLQGMYRPIRHFGIGISYATPLVIYDTHSMPSFTNVSTSDHWSSFWIPGFGARRPEYSYEQGPIASIIARGFIENTVNIYADVRLSFSSATERLSFAQVGREGADPPGTGLPPMAEVNIDHDEVHRLIFPSFHIGIMPHVFKHFYLDLNAGFQFIRNRSELEYSFEHYAYDNTTTVVIFSSPLPQYVNAITFNFGAGYFF